MNNDTKMDVLEPWIKVSSICFNAWCLRQNYNLQITLQLGMPRQEELKKYIMQLQVAKKYYR